MKLNEQRQDVLQALQHLKQTMDAQLSAMEEQLSQSPQSLGEHSHELDVLADRMYKMLEQASPLTQALGQYFIAAFQKQHGKEQPELTQEAS